MQCNIYTSVSMNSTSAWIHSARCRIPIKAVNCCYGLPRLHVSNQQEATEREMHGTPYQRGKRKLNKVNTISHYILLPRNGDFMAASTMPTSSCRLLGSWASPEAKAASASACRPRYWRATPCRKYACGGREGRRVRAAVSVPQHMSYM